ncbi:MAG: hypothetical protein JW773_06210 [Desulfuromonadales bacterium]|nr:hypothetical protein [Desulfuromonadales bacterium]
MQLNQLLKCLPEMDCAFNIPDSMFCFAIPSFLGVQAGQALNDVTVFVAEFYDFDRLETQQVIDSLKTLGACLDEESCSYKIRAGWLNANPAVVCIPDLDEFPENGRFKAVAFAKEGFINQKTAFKAVKRLESTLYHIGITFRCKNVVPLTRLDATV